MSRNTPTVYHGLRGFPTDACVAGATLYFIPIKTRTPLKFGAEVLNSVTCARARVTLQSRDGRVASGWGETPLSAAWAWPGELDYTKRVATMRQCCERMAAEWADFPSYGHPLEVGDDFKRFKLPDVMEYVSQRSGANISYLAALVCCSVFDQAVHDAYGQLNGVPTYATYGPEYMSRDLSSFLEPADGEDISFAGYYPCDFLRTVPRRKLPVWHLVGGLDPLEPEDLAYERPQDGYPTLLRDWITADGLKNLKIKLRGSDANWDYNRLVSVGQIALNYGVTALCADFNCTVIEAVYVTDILERLKLENPAIYEMLLYVEQPFPYDLEANRIAADDISKRKPLLLDESAHDWTYVRLGRSLGWSGVALKSCKTQTAAILSFCWAKAHGMNIMVQDLTNPMLAQIPHVQLAAYVDTMRGVESNAMQFYPDASSAEARVHPGLYRRRNGMLDLSTLQGPGFGYRLDEIKRDLPEPAVVCGMA